MTKYKYINEELRWLLSYKDNQICATLESRSDYLLFFKSWNKCLNTYVFETRPDEPSKLPGVTIRHNPMTLKLQSQTSTYKLEIWDISTFNLNKRLSELCDMYINTVSTKKEAKKILTEQLDQI